jgi:hypothetical protein
MIPLFLSSATEESNSNTVKNNEGSKVEVYYFHNTRRCATCNAVESVTKEALQENFATLLEDGSVNFSSLNLEEKEGEELAKKLNVSGQALLFVSGTKKIDLTNVGFMNALTKPEKLKSKVKEAMNKILD